MALSFLYAQPGSPATRPPKGRPRVLVTGASGNIGRYFAQNAKDRYALTLLLHSPEHAKDLQPFGNVIIADLSDLDALARACHGIDTVLHLAAAASPSSTWSQLLSANIVGTYNLMVAAKAARCRRVLYASSIHAVSGAPRDVQVKTTDPVNPGDLYGVSKCFAEALARYMATQEGLSVFALRIGGFQPIDQAKGDAGISMLDAFITDRDMQQILYKCIDDTRLQFAIFNCLSGNRFNRLDISDTRELLGYTPEDDTTELNPQLDPLDLDQKVIAHNASDPASHYQSGLREDLAKAQAALSSSTKPPRMSHNPKEPVMPDKSQKAPKTTPKPATNVAPANPSNFDKKTTPVRERMAKAIKDTPPDERLKKGR